MLPVGRRLDTLALNVLAEILIQERLWNQSAELIEATILCDLQHNPDKNSPTISLTYWPSANISIARFLSELDLCSKNPVVCN